MRVAVAERRVFTLTNKRLHYPRLSISSPLLPLLESEIPKRINYASVVRDRARFVHTYIRSLLAASICNGGTEHPRVRPIFARLYLAQNLAYHARDRVNNNNRGYAEKRSSSRYRSQLRRTARDALLCS